MGLFKKEVVFEKGDKIIFKKTKKEGIVLRHGKREVGLALVDGQKVPFYSWDVKRA